MENDEHFDPAGYLGSSEPPAATFGSWLRLNLTATMFVVSVVSGVSGAMISATWQIAMGSRTLDDVSTLERQHSEQLASLHRDMVDVDRRFNDDSAHLNEARRVRDAEVSVLTQRIAVLEAQMRFFGDRVGAKQLGAR